MSHENLWAPWRMSYIRREHHAAAPPMACFLCSYHAANPAEDRENLLLERTAHCLVVMNRYPYNNGHLLIAPASHGGELAGCSPAVLNDAILQVQRWVQLLSAHMRPEGFNVGLNLGRVAGAGLPGHLHWHIVPRWGGDTNFMDTTAGTCVIPQSLTELYDELRQLAGTSSPSPRQSQS